jgi:hypothetical protein
MAFICRRCDQLTQQLYRVTTKHRGAVLLNMLVCLSCAQQAKRLGLPVVKVESAKRADKMKSGAVVPAVNQQTVQP